MALRNFSRPSLWTSLKPFSRKFFCSDPVYVLSKSGASTSSLWTGKWWSNSSLDLSNSHARRHFQSSSLNLSDRTDRKDMLRSMPYQDQGTTGENIPDLDSLHNERSIFPDENTPDQLFNGVRFADLPIFHIKASPNNTIINLTDAQGTTFMIHSCGREGFKNTREGTNIAAQATAITIATRAVQKGYQDARVTVRGLGPGRMSAIKGLTMGGINVVSVTDVTPVTWKPFPRPKKQRKL